MSENAWMVSDTHFYHDRIIEFCPNTREGKDAVEMTELMIERWNKQVKPNDHVYHAGDFCFKGKERIKSVLQRLNGKIHLIYGNHDYIIKKDKELQGYFESVQQTKNVKIGEYRFVISHYPFAEWLDCHKGVNHIFGHLHGNKTNIQHLQRFKAMDVGVDTRGDKFMTPYHVDEVLSFVKDKEIMTHH